MNKSVTKVPVNRWAQFLQIWNKKIWKLDTAARMLQTRDVVDLDSAGKDLLDELRQWSDVLLLNVDDPFALYQKRLRRLHCLGALNLSFFISRKEEKVFILKVFVYVCVHIIHTYFDTHHACIDIFCHISFIHYMYDNNFDSPFIHCMYDNNFDSPSIEV